MHARPEGIHAYLAGELDEKERRSLERHVHRCLRCWEAVQTATPRTDPQWNSPAEFLQVPLNAHTLLSSAGPGRDSGGQVSSSRFQPWIPALALLVILAMLGALMSLLWALGAPGIAATAQHDPTRTWSAVATDLKQGDLDELRASGFTCPVIETAGFRLASATGTRSGGNVAVHIVLRNGPQEVGVTEVRQLAGGALATGTFAAPHQAAAKSLGADVPDGPLSELGRRLGAKTATAVSFGKGTATLSMDHVDYLITSNLSKEEVKQLLQGLVIGEHTRSAGPATASEELGERILRGLSRLMVLDFD